MNKKLYIGYDENIEDFRIGTWEEINSYDSITLKDTLEDFEISEIIEFIQDELNMATVLKVKVNKFEFIKDLEEINLIIEKLAGGQREIKLEIEDWITEQFLNIVEPNDDFATWPTISPIFTSSPGFMIIRSIVISSKEDFPSESPTSPPAFPPVELPKLAEIAVFPLSPGPDTFMLLKVQSLAAPTREP